MLWAVEQLLTIGEFAQRSGLSRSALRFYDQNGLLAPQLVDADTGYRYYAVTQLEQASMVRRLREAELPVRQLREFLEATAPRRRQILEKHSASFRERALTVESAVGLLRGELDRGDLIDSERWCTIAPKLFAEALNQVSFAVADPAVRADLGAVWVESKEDSLRLVATDSYRLAVRDLPPEAMGAAEIRGVIDAAHARTMAEQAASAQSLTLAQSAAGAVTALLDGRRSHVGGAGEGFPDYEPLLAGVPEGHRLTVARNELERALVTVPPHAERLSLGFGADQLLLAADGHREPIAAQWSGPAMDVWLDRRFFIEAVNATVGPDLVIEASGPLQPVTMRSADTGTFSVLTMPVRPPGQP